MMGLYTTLPPLPVLELMCRKACVHDYALYEKTLKEMATSKSVMNDVMDKLSTGLRPLSSLPGIRMLTVSSV